MRISFLEGTQPLTKTILRAKDGTISKNPYPLVATFTSHSYEIKSLVELYELITAHAARGHCLLKGSLQRELQHERRRGSTNGSTPTQWVCLDFDAVETPNLDDTLETMGIGSTDYIIQYSSSHGLDPELEGTVSAHVFMLLSEPIPPATLKSWLMEINFKLFDEQLELNASHMALRWPLDITTCQNDKLLYISPPNFKNMPDPVADRIQYVKKTSRTLDVQRIGTKPLEAMKSEARAKVNMLRTALGLTAIRKTVNKGEYEVQSSPDACVVTGVRKDSDFTRLNINGGDSWAYWHPNDNWELIHDYKTGLSYPTAKFIPDYYQELEQQREIALETPTADGDLVLGFVDLPTGSYFKGLWNEEKQRLSLYPARDRTQVCDWYMSHGLTPPDFIPQWRIYFDPRSDKILDTEDMTINTYRRSPLYEVTGNKDAQFPHIKSIVMHMLGGDDKVYEHFINWFACIFQRKHKPLTAWVVHGCEGTGKGYFYKNIVRPLLEPSNTFMVMANDIEDNFNGWLESKNFIFVDEVDVDDFKEKGRVTAKLRNYITEPKVSIRKMRAQAAEYDNWTAWLFGSNKKQPVYIPATDRRYNVGNYQPSKLPRPDDDVVATELENFARYLKAHKADPKLADSIIFTEDRERIAALAVTSVDETSSMILSGDLEKLWEMKPDDHMLGISPIAMQYRNLIERLRTKKPPYLTRDEMWVIFEYTVGKIPASPGRFGAYLRHQGIVLQGARFPVRWKET